LLELDSDVASAVVAIVVDRRNVCHELVVTLPTEECLLIPEDFIIARRREFKETPAWIRLEVFKVTAWVGAENFRLSLDEDLAHLETLVLPDVQIDSLSPEPVHYPDRLEFIWVSDWLREVVDSLLVPALHPDHLGIVKLVKELVIRQRGILAYKVPFFDFGLYPCEHVSKPEHRVDANLVDVVDDCAERYRAVFQTFAEDCIVPLRGKVQDSVHIELCSVEIEEYDITNEEQRGKEE